MTDYSADFQGLIDQTGKLFVDKENNIIVTSKFLIKGDRYSGQTIYPISHIDSIRIEPEIRGSGLNLLSLLMGAVAFIGIVIMFSSYRELDSVFLLLAIATIVAAAIGIGAYRASVNAVPLYKLLITKSSGIVQPYRSNKPTSFGSIEIFGVYGSKDLHDYLVPLQVALAYAISLKDSDIDTSQVPVFNMSWKPDLTDPLTRMQEAIKQSSTKEDKSEQTP